MTNNNLNSICFVSPFAYPLLVNRGAGSGGAERQFFLFGRGLVKAGWQVSFITSPPEEESLGVHTSLPVFCADFSYLGGSKWHILTSWLSFWKAMKKADSDFYVLKVPGHLLPLMAAFCRLHRRRLVFWAQMGFDANPLERSFGGLAGLLQDVGIRYTDTVVAQNHEQKEGFAHNYGIKAHLVRSICDRIATEKTPAEQQLTDVLWVGNTHAKKRPEIVFELATLMPDLRFVMAANIGDRASFDALHIRAKGIPNLQFLGQVPPAEMESWFGRTRIFLNTSEREGFPNTFLQAWMNAVPVISLQIDPDGLIQEKGLGAIVAEEILATANEFPVSFARCLIPYIRIFLADENLRQSAGRRARSYVEENHSPETVVPHLIKTLLTPQSQLGNG